MLVLSKLEWEVNLVIALDYLEPLNSLLTMPKAVTNESKNLICTLSSRYTTFRAIYSARIVALAALNVAQKNILSLCQPDETLLSACKTHFAIHKTPPNSQQLSPFKVESSSTPKTSRTPLKDSHNLMKQNTRRRLTSLNTTNEETKENNDSAIGLLSTSAESPSGPSSKASSQQSSPDSGASSGSPGDNKDLHKLLESTHISAE